MKTLVLVEHDNAEVAAATLSDKGCIFIGSGY